MTRKPEQRSLDEVRELLRSLEAATAADGVGAGPAASPAVVPSPSEPTSADPPVPKPSGGASWQPAAGTRSAAPLATVETVVASPAGSVAAEPLRAGTVRERPDRKPGQDASSSLKAVIAISTAGICAAGIWYAFLAAPRGEPSFAKAVLPIADATATGTVVTPPKPAPAAGPSAVPERASQPAGVRPVAADPPAVAGESPRGDRIAQATRAAATASLPEKPKGEALAEPPPQHRIAQAALPKETAPLADARPAPPPPLSRSASDSETQIVVPETVPLQAGRSQPFPLEVSPASVRQVPAALVISGLPAGVSLSKGLLLQAGAWSVPVAELAQLAIALPDQLSGRFPVSIQLRLSNAGLAATASTTLVVAPRGQPPPATMSDSNRPDETDFQKLVADGKKQLESGNIAAARLLFRRAADFGHGEAARLLGDTFDPAKLYVLGAKGTTGDIEQAIYWYERADELGDPQAKARLLALGR